MDFFLEEFQSCALGIVGDNTKESNATATKARHK